jgi:hypothetical protein
MLTLAKKIGNKLRSFAARSRERGSPQAARAILSPRRKFTNKPVVIILFALAVAVFLIPKQAHADLFDIGTVASNAIGYVCFVVLYVVSYIAAAIIAVITYLISIFLALNTHVVDAFAVQMGSSVALSIANLGFVLGIIVIAIATILHAQTYGIKQILWKLVVAAILVNFSLVIAGAIIGVASNFTTYFMTALPGGGSSFDTFASALAGAMQPHTLVLNFDTNATNKVPGVNDASGAAQAGATLGALLQPILNIAFVAGFLIVIVITLVVFLFMLIIRYLYLGILLILMPFAWLMWIFPKFQHLWSKWWSMFLKWTFFAPIVMFFLYLAITTASVMNGSSGNQGANPLNQLGNLATHNSTASALDQFMGSFAQATLGTFLQMLMVIGLAVGGMIAANSLSITGAGVALGAMKSAGKWTQGYVGKQTAKAGRATWQKVGGEKAEKALREGRIGAQLKKVGFERVGGMVQRGESLAGRAIGKVSKNEAMVEEARKKVPENWDKAKEALAGNMNTQDNLAHIARGVSLGKIKATDKVGNMTVAEYMDQRDLTKRFGQEKLVDDTNILFGEDANSRSAKRAQSSEEAKTLHRNEEDSVKFGHKQHYDDSIKLGATKEEAETDAAAMDELTRKKFREEFGTTTVKVIDNVKDAAGNIIYKEGDTVPADELKNAAEKSYWEKRTRADAAEMDVNTRFGPATSPQDMESLTRNIATYAPQLVPTLLRNMQSPALLNFRPQYEKALNSLIGEFQKKAAALKTDTSPGGQTQFYITNQILRRMLDSQREFERIFLSSLGAARWTKTAEKTEKEAEKEKEEEGEEEEKEKT